jgi:YgiT-type zinc finger domain-containing protein
LGSGVPQEAQAVNCVVCRHGETKPGFTTFAVERNGAILVVRGVPARVCENCGDYRAA